MPRFGRLPAKTDPTTPRFADYVDEGLAAPPAKYSNLWRVYANLRTLNVSYLFPMDGNGAIGDCTIAALAHAQTVYRGLVGALCIWGKADVEKLYFQLTGGQDTGLVVLDVLRYWQQHPVNNDRILGFVSVDPKNTTHVKQAISLFGGVYIGFQVQQNCVGEFDAGLPWTPGPLTGEGHAVFVPDYSDTDVLALTWGSTEHGTNDWWNECVDECYAIVPPEAYNPKFEPGFNVAALIADLQTVRN